MIDQFIKIVIRPPRAEYDPDQYLWEKEFTLAGRKYRREDMELKNERGHALKCSHYLPSDYPDYSSLPCVVYCHGNSGCRADANEPAVVLLPLNITIFTLDFSGSGLSDGDYVSLGWHEKDDLKAVLSYLRSNKKASCIGLWGRSMGAVTCLLCGAEDPSIAGMVLDSAFSNLFNLMLELADVYKIRLPKFTVKMALQYMRRVIVKKAQFDIKQLDCLEVATKTYIPALFGHGKDDKFIHPQHSDVIFDSYSGDKNMIKFEGDHNSSRPQFYYDSVSIFFHSVLHPPRPPSMFSTKIESYYDFRDMKMVAKVDENLLYEIIAGFQSTTNDTASSSSGPCSASATKTMGELFAENALDFHDILDIEDAEVHRGSGSQMQREDCGSLSSSNQASWGRCSSIEEDDELSVSHTCNSKHNETAVKVLETPDRSSQKTILSTLKRKSKNKKTKKGKEADLSRTKKSKSEALEALSHRLRHCILKKVHHRKHSSSP